MRGNLLAAVFLGLSLLASAPASPAENLVVDASFESPLPSWFAERAGTSYYALKQRVADACDGHAVLVVSGWDRRGSKILAPAIRPAEHPPRQLSATVAVRSIGQAAGATLELALFDEQGARQLGSFGQLALDGAGRWSTLAKTGVSLTADAFRLAFVLKGPSAGLRVEIDCLGLFAGNTLETIRDNSDLSVVEAETLADGTVWKAVEHYPSWYQGTPSGMQMLAGFDALKPEQNRPLVRSVPVRQAGPHTLWIRHLSSRYAGRFTVALRQNGVVIAEKEIVANDVPNKTKSDFVWVWQGLCGELRAGTAEIVLTRPAQGSSWTTRKIDLFVLVNRRDYTPEIEHFQTPGYLRFTNLTDAAEPYCLWLFVRRHQGPHWYATPGMLTHAGLSQGHAVPADKGKWLAPGETSPWVRVSDYLLAAGDRNNVQIVATRRSHTEGYVSGPIRGRLEFASGADFRPLKTLLIDQAAPRTLLTLSHDLREIKTPYDYLAEAETHVSYMVGIEAALTVSGSARTERAQTINLGTTLGLQSGVDDPEVLRREIEILKKLGLNVTYAPVAPPETAAAFARQHGLLPRFGAAPHLWSCVQYGSQHHPDAVAMQRKVDEFVERQRPLLPHCIRAKLMDEPGGMSYEQIAGSEPCRQKFVAWLQSQALTPAALGVKNWAEVAPVLPAQRESRRELFYYTGLFRLEAFATLARACVAAKQQRLPDGMRSYVNYSPPNSGGSWTERGTDLFLAHRAGGLELIWTEDWLGYSAGPQHLSDILALCRAAGREQQRPLGAYCVGQATPTLMRMKIYTLLAGGVRDIQYYSYGPWYAGIDSWARNFAIYNVIRDCNFEISALDAALAGTARRPTDVAILYNRTASIWGLENNSPAMNGSFTHWALAHAGYDADFLDETDVENGQLGRYKVLYLDGPQLRREAAAAIAAWVRQGGTLCASAGAGTRDAFDRPTTILDAVYGAKSVELLVKANVGRPRYELRALKPLDTFNAVDQSAAAVAQLCFRERLDAVPDAQPLLVDQQRRPAGVLNAVGRGRALRLAALPGVAYVHEALQPPYQIESYLPTNFRSALRDFIAWPARLAGARRVARADCPLAEIVRYDAADRAVVFVIDHRTTHDGPFTFHLPDAPFDRARAASGSAVELKATPDGGLNITLLLGAADAVVLTKRSGH